MINITNDYRNNISVGNIGTRHIYRLSASELLDEYVDWQTDGGRKRLTTAICCERFKLGISRGGLVFFMGAMLLCVLFFFSGEIGRFNFIQSTDV
jgi:hypothetical protein